MRLWHYKLIPALPKAQLISQWRECISIKRKWENGTLNHRLVNYVMNYNGRYFYNYVGLITDEMVRRNINFNIELFEEIQEFCKPDLFEDNFEIYYPEHNDAYLIQCYYNLQEKHDRGIISEKEWQKILKVAYEEDIIE